MVLAAGLGTRLRPLTDVLAKPLVPVGDRPALVHVLERVRAAGHDRIVVNAHHRAGDIRAFAETLPYGVAVSEERELLGTAGGIAFARELLGEGDVLVWNGDILADVDASALAATHNAASEAHQGTSSAPSPRPASRLAAPAATLVVQPLGKGQGPVGLDERGRVCRLRQERFAEEAAGAQFLGISVLSGALRAHLPEPGVPGGLVEDLLVPALRRGETVGAFLFEGPWHDIGTVPSYLAANVAWLEARGLTHWVGPGARVEQAVSLDRTIVGEGASVAGAGSLARCVVWPGARATAPMADAVVT